MSKQKAKISETEKIRVFTTDESIDLLEQLCVEIKTSKFCYCKEEYQSNLNIYAYEILISSAERRAVYNKEHVTSVRILDFVEVIQLLANPIELENGKQQFSKQTIVQHLLGSAIKARFNIHFPSPLTYKRGVPENPYTPILTWFSNGGTLDLLETINDFEYSKILQTVPGLIGAVRKYTNSKELRNTLFSAELLIFGLAEYGTITKTAVLKGFTFKDSFNSMFDLNNLGNKIGID